LSDEGFIARWSRRKAAATAGPDRPTAAAVPAAAGTQSTTSAAPAETPAAEARPALPDVESLTPDSDFTPFMEPHVNADTRREAVKRLFQDPRYNVMDGLDVYIDDYSKPDPLPAGWLEKMTQTSRLGEYREPDPESEPPIDQDVPAAQPENQAVGADSPDGATEGRDPPPDTPDRGSDPPPLVK
jgi:hypothetical protein